MCGIAGIFDQHSIISQNTLKAMTECLHHRGPDSGGFFIRNSNLAPYIGFGHRRLSILDLSLSGHQPMSSPDGLHTITFNGEIYNFKDIRLELENKGHAFGSTSDTEVLLHSYIEWDLDFLDKIEGMFAFALWDEQKQRLLLARDRFGEKPLHFSFLPNGQFIFASEPKAFFKNPSFEPHLNANALTYYLQYEYVPSPYSIYQHTGKLSASHYMLWEKGQWKTQRYWKASFSSISKNSSHEKVLSTAKSLLKHSIQSQMISDVPLGVFLSGGIDSSTIVTLMSELCEPGQIKSFTIGFNEQSFDESNFARQVARTLGLQHHEQILSVSTMLELLPSLFRTLDEPMADSSIIPTLLLCRFARQQVTVALSGDGGDELLAGYDPFLAHFPACCMQWLPPSAVQLFLRILKLMPASEKNMSPGFRLQRFFSGLTAQKMTHCHQIWLGSFQASEQAKLLTPEVRRSVTVVDPLFLLDALREECRCTDSFDEALLFYQRFYLNGSILTKTDTSSMLNSLEVRAPFLDRKFVEYVNALPRFWKLNGLVRKYLLRRMMGSQLESSLLNRPKKGFGIPLAKWLKNELTPDLDYHFSKERLDQDGIFNFAYVSRLLSEHRSGSIDRRKELWTLLVFQYWQEHFQHTPPSL